MKVTVVNFFKNTVVLMWSTLVDYVVEICAHVVVPLNRDHLS